MKNKERVSIKHCMFIMVDDFNELLHDIGINVDVSPDLDGLTFYNINENESTDWDEDKIMSKLSEFFDVQITSLHADDCDYPGIWIAYKEKEEPLLDKGDVLYYPDIATKKVYQVEIVGARYDAEITGPNSRGSSFLYGKTKNEFYEYPGVAKRALEKEILVRKILEYLYKHQGTVSTPICDEILKNKTRCSCGGRDLFDKMYRESVEVYSTAQLIDFVDRINKKKI